LIETGQTEEAILETLKTKSTRGIRSTLILEIFLSKYLPESGGALIDPDSLLHLFKMAGREIDNDPYRTEIFLRALERFMRAYPAYPLLQIVETLISGISYSPKDQMTDFYINAIKVVYDKAAASGLPDHALLQELVNIIDKISFSISPDLNQKLGKLKREVFADFNRRTAKN